MSAPDGMDALHRVQDYLDAAKSRRVPTPFEACLDNVNGVLLRYEDVAAVAEYAAATIDGFTGKEVTEERKRAAAEIEKLRADLHRTERQVSHLRGQLRAFGTAVESLGEAMQRDEARR